MLTFKMYDMHSHWRQLDPDGSDGMIGLNAEVYASSYSGVLLMPNTKPPLTTVQMVRDYLDQAENVNGGVAGKSRLDLKGYIYLTKQTTPEDVYAIPDTDNDYIAGFKWYPQGATTNSDDGVGENEILELHDTLSAMERLGVTLSIHGEVANPKTRLSGEVEFMERIFPKLRDRYPQLRIILEHISTKESARYILDVKDPYTFATLTAHHLTTVDDGGVDPHKKCFPPIKLEEDRQALLDLIRENCRKIGAGTDSAPHELSAKLSPNPPGGCFTAPIAPLLYATACDEAMDGYEVMVNRRMNALCFNNARDWLKFDETKVPSAYVKLVKTEPFQTGGFSPDIGNNPERKAVVFPGVSKYQYHYE